jgi:DNA-binding GntR family transcriptional regulator
MASKPETNSIKVDNASLEEFREKHKALANSHVIAERVHTRLRDAILSAELHPNSRLVEDELAKWLEVSRTPIREALFLLEQEGLVDRTHGWIVREHDPMEIRNRLESRLAIEGFAARLAAVRRSETHIKSLKSIADKLEKKGITRNDVRGLNDTFHKVIVDAAHNATLTTLHSQTNVNYWNLTVPVVFPPRVSQDLNEQHRTLIDALIKEDGDWAESIIRKHHLIILKTVLNALGMQDKDILP